MADVNAEDYSKSLIHRQFAEIQSQYPPPEDSIVDAMLDSIVDISRMLGILLTAYACESSLDTDLLDRNRQWSLRRNIRVMRYQLANLPLPRAILAMNIRFIRLVDTSLSGSRQLLGNFVLGDYDVFQSLHEQVVHGTANRRRAYAELRRMYPLIGDISDTSPTSLNNQVKLDVISSVINGVTKLVPTGSSTAPYTYVSGSSADIPALHSGGFMHCAFEGQNTLHTISRFAAPGSGHTYSGGGSASVYSSNFGNLCFYDRATQLDSLLADTNASFSELAGNLTFQAKQNIGALIQLATGHNINNASYTDGAFTISSDSYNVPLSQGSTGQHGGTADFWPGGLFDLGSIPAFGHDVGDLYITEDQNVNSTLEYLLRAGG
jgi:hypothetical protein